ncbi:unnamed protein product [Phyllotreta striolata]|uniref:Uncharacterized protein n=1 Tax=Phyllotreta striolata TaxID=444603 RepID=A0A9N9TK69_PHYSR|nr:unnamed protein product [Phyllotreta striolata]
MPKIGENIMPPFAYQNKSRTLVEKVILPFWSNIILATIAGFCLKDYYYEVTFRDIQHYAFVSYLLVIANSLSALLHFTNDSSYCDLRILLDYAQQVMCFPMVLTDFLLKYNIAPASIAVIPSILSLLTVFLFVLLEYKRQDLTDLNILICLITYTITGMEYNAYACIAALFIGTAYFRFKRNEGVCIRKASQYNLLMAGFVFFSLLSLDNGVSHNKMYKQQIRGW